MDAHGSVPDVILIGAGSEVSVALSARDRLAEQGVQARVVSMPCWALLAGVGVGCYTDIVQACRAAIPLGTTSTPSAEHRAVYDRNYRIYRAMTLAALEVNRVYSK